jgi:hypothetical protein
MGFYDTVSGAGKVSSIQASDTLMPVNTRANIFTALLAGDVPHM